MKFRIVNNDQNNPSTFTLVGIQHTLPPGAVILLNGPQFPIAGPNTTISEIDDPNDQSAVDLLDSLKSSIGDPNDPAWSGSGPASLISVMKAVLAK